MDVGGRKLQEHLGKPAQERLLFTMMEESKILLSDFFSRDHRSALKERVIEFPAWVFFKLLSNIWSSSTAFHCQDTRITGLHRASSQTFLKGRPERTEASFSRPSGAHNPTTNRVHFLNKTLQAC